MFLLVLSQFPLRDRDQQISKFGSEEDLKDAQELLDEAMESRRKEARAELEIWLRADGQFNDAQDGKELVIRNDEREWLLQILNNVRVGAWQQLGEPEDLTDAFRSATEESIRNLTIMEMAGNFQSVLFFDEENE